ncbi:undecaprenyl-diphosphatase UppP [Candidatus Parcubacteria bacterium]|nr:undecaprenyl-diphosphatase UppP [Candidatus Parcubacteria bacterium]
MIEAIILGAIQGITEFLPISSSGHLIIIREVLGLKNVGSLSFDAVLQLATTLAVIVYFWKDLIALVRVRDTKKKILIWAIVVGTIPAAILGFIFEQKIDSVFRNAHTVAWALIAGSVLFFIAERYSAQRALKNIDAGLIGQQKELSVLRGFWVGCFQVLALIPGMSRSGSTISGGLLTGMKREEVVRFSFLLSVPILLGSGLKKLFDLGASGTVDTSLVVGSLVAFVVGLASIHFLIKYLQKHTLNVFIVYRILLAVVVLLFL